MRFPSLQLDGHDRAEFMIQSDGQSALRGNLGCAGSTPWASIDDA